MEYYAKSATKSLSDDEKSEIVKKIKSAIEIVEDNLTQSEKTAIDNSIDEFINITEKGQVTLSWGENASTKCIFNYSLSTPESESGLIEQGVTCH